MFLCEAAVLNMFATVPSQEKIYQQLLLNNEVSAVEVPEARDAANMELYLIQQGLAIQHDQCVICIIVH